MIGAFLLPRFGRFWGWCQGKTSASPCWNSATSRPTMSTLEWFWGLQLGSWKNHGNNSRKVGGITWYNAITIYNCHKSYKYGTITVINPTYNLYSMIYGFTSTCNWNCGPKGGWIADRENPCTSMAVEPWFPGKVFPCIEWWLKCDFCISFATAGWSCFFLGTYNLMYHDVPILLAGQPWMLQPCVSMLTFSLQRFLTFVCFRGVGRDPTRNAHSYRGTHSLELEGCN